MISPVSFKAAQPVPGFEELVNRPQSFTTKEEKPSGATGIDGEGKKKGSVPKTIAKVVLGAAAIAAALGLIAKTGALKINPEGNAILNKVKGGINTAGEFILNKAAALKDKVMPKVSQAAENMEVVV